MVFTSTSILEEMPSLGGWEVFGSLAAGEHWQHSPRLFTRVQQQIFGTRYQDTHTHLYQGRSYVCGRKKSHSFVKFLRPTLTLLGIGSPQDAIRGSAVPLNLLEVGSPPVATGGRQPPDAPRRQQLAVRY